MGKEKKALTRAVTVLKSTASPRSAWKTNIAEMKTTVSRNGPASPSVQIHRTSDPNTFFFFQILQNKIGLRSTEIYIPKKSAFEKKYIIMFP